MAEFLTYEQFGAKGDGVTDDFDAIIACHEEANRTGTPVKARDGAKYYVAKVATATVKTDVDFGTAEFIIDDVNVPLDKKGTPIFSVPSTFEDFTPEITSLSAGQKKIDFPHEGKVYVRVYNDNHRIFIRKGLNMNNGAATQDCFIVDAEGNILTDIDWDYGEFTKVYARRVDDTPIILKGGKFTTIANQAESFYNYYGRNIAIRRSNVTVDGLTHIVTGELDHGAPYGSFIGITECCNVTVKNCILTPHLIYWTESKVPGKPVAMGSYDINLGASIGIKCINITQTVDIYDKRYWGIVCSNFCKDLYFDGCIISRFDAHQGVTNVTLKNCEFGHQRVNLIGHGEALIENCKMTGPTLFGLRGDYGSVWFGSITLKNCTLTVNTPGQVFSIFGANNIGNHDFGYECCSPTVLTVDGLFVDDKDGPDKTFSLLPDYMYGYNGEDIPYPYVPVKRLVLSGVKRASGNGYVLCNNSELYRDTVIEEK